MAKTHIMRLAPQDVRTSRVRARSVLTADPMLRLVYYEALYALYEAGGTLRVEALPDELMIPVAEIERCLPILDSIARSSDNGNGGLIVEDGKVWNPRIVRELDAELAFRETQRENGGKGGRAAGKRRSAGGKKAPAKRVLSDGRADANPPPSPPFASADASTYANANAGEQASSRAPDPPPVESGPRTPATPAEATAHALSVLGARAPVHEPAETPGRASGAAVNPPLGPPCTDPAAYVVGGVAYRAGDTLPDGRRVESVEGGVPVLIRPSRAGAPGELEAAQRALILELPLAAEALRMPADLTLAKYSRTPNGAVIDNPWNCTRLAWIQATTSNLRRARLSAQADAYAATPPPERAPMDAEGAEYRRIRALADEYGAWCDARGVPADHRESRDAWFRETGHEVGDEQAAMVFTGEMRRLGYRQRERAAS